MSHILAWLGRHKRALATLLVAVVILSIALILFFSPGSDRLAYASPLSHAPEALKQQLRPWRAPRVNAVVPFTNASDVLERSSVTIAFTTPMNKAATESAVHFDPPVQGSYTWANDSTLIFTPQDAWPSGGTVTVHVGAAARSWVMRPKESEFTSHFTVIGPPTVVTTTPAQNARFAAPYRDAGITITFSRAMDEKTVTDRVIISPPLQNQRFGWVGNKLFAYGATQPSTSYRVALLPGARDKTYGLEMKDGYDWSFTITKMAPNLGLLEQGRYGQFSAYQPKSQQLNVVNVSRVDARLYTLDIPTYLKLRGFSYDDWGQFHSESLPFLRGWTIPVDARADQQQPITVDPGDLAPGMYMLLLTAPEDVRDSQVVMVAKTALTLKRTDRQVLAWATDMASGLPVAGAQVTFYDGKGQTLAGGTTDGDGIVTSAITQTTGLIHALAKRDSDLAAASSDWQTGIEPWRFDTISWQWDQTSKDYNVFIYTDRPLYRAGQTLYFKGIIRADQDGQYSQPPAGTDVYVEIANWSNQTLYKKTLKTTDFGSINDDFVISNEAKLGDYQIRVSVGRPPDPQQSWQYQSSFRVEEYRKPEYAVSVRTDKPSYINGDTMNVSIKAAYFFGAPAPNAKVRYTVFSEDYWFSWNANPDFDFDFAQGTGDYPPAQFYYGGKQIQSREATTDANGNLLLQIPVDISQEQRSQIYMIEATVSDSSNQPISGQATAIVHRGTYYIGAQPASWVATTGKATSFNVQTVDVSGQVTGSVALKYTLSRVDWTFTPDSSGKGPKGKTGTWVEKDTTLSSGNLTTGSDGSVRLPFTPDHGGSYRLDLEGRDGRGNRLLGQAWLWVSDVAYVNWQFDNNDRLNLKADKRHYQPGETAHVLVPSPYQSATALVTIERGTVISRKVMAVGNSTALDIPIDASYFPNVYVAVVLVPRDSTAPGFKVGYAELRVDSAAHNLTVSVAADKGTYRPGDTAVYTIKTADSSGKGVSAEVSVGVVDAALLALAPDSTRDIVDAYYGRRNLSVQVGGNLAIMLGRVNVSTDYGGDGGGGAASEQVRTIFPDTAYWNPTITTDASGAAQVKVTLPDNLTTWRTFVKGVTPDTKAGAATTDVVVNKDLIVRPELPRFLTAGDSATIGSIVHNFTGQDADVSVSIEVDRLNLGAGVSAKRQVHVANGASVRVDWPIVAGGAEQSAVIVMRASAGSASDAVQATLPIVPFGERVVSAVAGQTVDTAATTLNLPAQALFATLSIDTSGSLAGGLIDSLQYLTGYPYGCVEQTMSRFLPDVLVKQTLDRLGIANKQLSADLPNQVEDSLTRLYGMQHYDGGWGWWEGDQSDAHMTAYVVYGLNEARKTGFAVDQNVLKQGALFLRDPLAKTTDLNLKTYLVFVLSEYGEGDISLARSLLARQSELTLESKAYLAQTLKLVNSPAEAKDVTDDLAARAVQTATVAHWQESKQLDQYMMSNGRTTAVALQAIERVDPANAIVPKVVRWIMDSRQGGYWRTTQETAATIIALTDFLARSNELDANFRYSLSVNSKEMAGDQVNKQNLFNRVHITTSPISGSNEITLAKQGQGTLYYSAALQYYLQRDSIGAATAGGGPTVTRTYANPDTGKPLTSFKTGDLVQVYLTVTTPTDLWYVIVNDPLPAGMESVNETLRTSSIKDGKATSYWMHPEYRDQATSFFGYYLWQGTHTFSYMVRATTAGSFRAMPAEVYPMYTPEVWGRSSSSVVDIGQ